MPKNTMTLEEFRQLTKETKSKYWNRKVVIDGITFASGKEGDRYCVLKLRRRVKEIYDLKLQPEFVLQEGFESQDRLWMPIVYRADFGYREPENPKEVIEDVKAFNKKTGKFLFTKEYKIKKKLFLKKYGHIYDFREV